MTTYTRVGGDALAKLLERQKQPVRAIATPFPTWNSACKAAGGGIGLAHGWYTILAGNPSKGKTYVALNIAAEAVRAGHAVAFHTLEMGWDELTVRLLPIVADVPAYQVAQGKHFSAATFERAADRMDEVRGEIHINDEPLFRLTDLIDGMARMHEERGCVLHVVDYLQLIWVKNAEKQNERILEVSQSVRAVTKKHNIVTVGLSQFNRDTSKVQEEPRIQGLMGGSSLENDADQIAMLNHAKWWPTVDEAGRSTGWKSYLALGKNRHGPSGVEIPIVFEEKTNTVRERFPDEITDDETSTPTPQLRRRAS